GRAGDAEWAAATVARIAAIPNGPLPAPAAPPPPIIAAARHAAGAYRERILACQAAIAAGEAYQLCLVNEFRVEAESIDAVAVHRRLRAMSPAHHGGFVRIGGVALASASPELFLHVGPERRVTTKPIKGTRPRGADADSDRALAAELVASEKERAENLMIVDLMRNDLGRVASLGSVVVDALFAVESYPQVHQLVSTVSARLAAGVGPIDAVRAAFPAGSMTGAPKLRAMQLLHGFEDGPRGVYSGAFGRLGDDGALDLAMVIRSIVVVGAVARIGAGGGITALSDPDEEVEEVRVKARALLAAVGAAVPAEFAGREAS
ncbi:anthranilate synthase component I family protein, partial [Agromyces seonyuensis]